MGLLVEYEQWCLLRLLVMLCGGMWLCGPFVYGQVRVWGG